MLLLSLSLSLLLLFLYFYDDIYFQSTINNNNITGKKKLQKITKKKQKIKTENE